MRRSEGFTIIELLVAMTVMAFAALAVGACLAWGRRVAPLVATGLVTAVMGLQLASQLLVLTSAYA